MFLVFIYFDIFLKIEPVTNKAIPSKKRLNPTTNPIKYPDVKGQPTIKIIPIINEKIAFNIHNNHPLLGRIESAIEILVKKSIIK